MQGSEKTAALKQHRRNRIAGSLAGLLVGDALGVPYEFNPPQALPPAEKIEFEPPAGFRRAHSRVAPGTWSDDGAQALVLSYSLLECGGLDLDHFAEGLLRWRDEGYCAVDGDVFDIGIQTSRALDRLRAGVPPESAGPAGERDNGNGSLMRVLPIALWHTGPDDELCRLAMRQSLPTHGHARSQIACALYCLWVRRTFAGTDDAWDEAVATLRGLTAALAMLPAEVELVLDPVHSTQCKGTGYVVDSLWSARAAIVETDDFESCVRRAVAFGNDTDTTAAIAGGVAGARYGLSGIPWRWRRGLRGRKEILAPLLDIPLI
ncbi:ADP-ribosylglycohydrolase family protein [Luteimonas sp. MC1572]|uniref:ADP-ribosylglycohydrolase family protein n=1 Tax=Luteimonas sp. MC1572 TaxID=2799325 RepID=UPI0018F0B9C8|nr:ADP-ribosylglycohydrolase family protein [Luteimonas sp. MC1572]MBJ6981661.1 ADP-ribosylglycohydrolase family protein [Luteimonas sp. MC1572]QQO02953.1 ADP-ribosylglycohydrolase family protein [Luteimonas sp. MC1572]